MLLDTSGTTRKIFYLLGTRVRPGIPQSNGTGEKVAVLVTRDVLGLNGVPHGPTEVLQEDQPLVAAWDAGPFRYESEIAPYKPEPDVVAVGTIENMVNSTPATAAAAEDALAAINLGNPDSVAIDRGAGFGPPLLLPRGWRPRARVPRKAEAGDAANFNMLTQALPNLFTNGFFNGQPCANQALFAPGDRLRFTDANGPHIVRIPAAPVLRVEDGDGAPLQPPVQMVPHADTVVFDRSAATFTVVWRAVLPWQDRFATAKLVVQ